MELLSCETFAGRAGETFDLSVGDSTLSLTLMEVTPLPARPFPGRMRAPFSLVFRGSTPVVLPQRYADWMDGPGYAIGPEGWDRTRLNLGVSLGLYSRGGWSLTGEYDGVFSNGEIMNGLRIEASKTF